MLVQNNVSRTGRALNPVWPFAVPLIGLPVWWLLGVWQLMFFAMAVPMVVFLLRQRSIAMPRGFGMWLLWLVWLLTGLLVMQVDAPGTVPGINLNRYASFGLRFGWYLVATIAALYIVNARRVLSSQKVVQAVAWFFVSLTAGGLLGLFAPDIDFPSVLQAILPDGLASNAVVNELTRVRSAQVQDFLGDPQPRPSAPFIYTNAWGFATAISLPFFVAAWWVRGRAWRIAMVGVLVLALFAIISSLNRGVWLAVLVAAALAVVQAALRGRIRLLAIAIVLAVAALTLVVFSPLGDLVTARLETGHSDAVRGNLAATALQTAAEGSPVVGFGTTRYVLGTFASIAGGATDACPSCEPPPIGTHGQLWLVAFGAGFVGVVLYIGFIAGQFLRYLRARSAIAMASSTGLLLLLVTLPIYDAVGIPLYLGFIGVGLLSAESLDPRPSLRDATMPIWRNVPVLALCVLVGGLGGFAFNAIVGAPVTATQRVVVPAAPLVPVSGARPSTLDSEAIVARSTPVVTAVAEELEIPVTEVRRSLRISAEPNTRVLLVTYEAPTAAQAQRGAEIAVAAFLDTRSALLGRAADDIRARYTALQQQLDAIYQEIRPLALETQRGHLWTVLATVTRGWTEAAEILEQTEEPTEARAISEATVARADDAELVRVASGLAVGLLFGILLISGVDRRLQRVGDRPRRRIDLGIPVVASASPEDLSVALRAISAYEPIAGLVSDPDSSRALRLASGLEAAIDTVSRSGARTLVVVDVHSRARTLRKILAETRQAGLDPVGAVVCRHKSPSKTWWPRLRKSM